MSDGSHDNPYACLRPAKERRKEAARKYLDALEFFLEQADGPGTRNEIRLSFDDHRLTFAVDDDLAREIKKQLHLLRGRLLKEVEGCEV
jgi:hypothetical protein